MIIVLLLLSALLAIVIPAGIGSRERARFLECQTNLRQISLGALNYESLRKHLPPGILGVAQAYSFENGYLQPSSPHFWQRYQYTSSLTLILPFIEQTTVFDALHPVLVDVDRPLIGTAKPRYEWFGDVEGAIETAKLSISTYLCPSDQVEMSRVREFRGAIQPVFLDDIQDEGVATRDLLEEIGEPVGMTNYSGCMGADAGGIPMNPDRHRFLGLMSSRQKMKLRDAKDGTSKTILYGEMLGRISRRFLGTRLAIQSWMFGGLARGRGELD